MRERSREIAKSMAEDLRFIKGWIKQPKTVGSIKPTSRQAAKLMVDQIPKSDLPILELGPGTGVITSMMIESGIEPSRITSIEFDTEFCTFLSKEMPDVNFIEGDAFNLRETLKGNKDQKFGAILSGIPLLNFPKEDRQALIENSLEWIADGGPLIQLCYGPKPPVPAKIGSFTARPTKWVLSNIPPARFWIYESDKNAKA